MSFVAEEFLLRFRLCRRGRSKKKRDNVQNRLGREVPRRGRNYSIDFELDISADTRPPLLNIFDFAVAVLFLPFVLKIANFAEI